MNETMSLVLATAILAIGGLGLYMYKQPDSLDFGNDDKSYEDDDEVEKDYTDEDYNDRDEDMYSEDSEPRVRSRGKTKRAKTGKGTKRRKY